MSDPQDETLDWAEGGCEGASRQFAQDETRWIRADVSTDSAVASIRRFDPAASRYSVEHYFLAADTLAAARALQAKYPAKACTPDGARMAGNFTQALRDLLPAAANERLVYACEHVQKAPAER